MPRSETWLQLTAVGRVENEPELRSTAGGTSVANLRVSTERSYKDKSGEWKTSKTYHKVTVFGEGAASLSGVEKGALVLIQGEIENRSYESNGETKWVTEIKADRVQLLAESSGKRTESTPARSAVPSRPSNLPRAGAALAPRTAPANDDTFITDEDLPDEVF